ncbi:MAG: hypothetical protein HY563_09265 [Ignavibacteriales bacterium]|nr:hypothetical protein [Ignavibacteriales bacterium]
MEKATVNGASNGAYRFQWKWVWITLGMFVVLYFVPLAIASTIRGELGFKVIGGWMFAGVVVISGLAGFLSKGVTIWEPAVAGGLITILWYTGIQVVNVLKGFAVRLDLGPLLVFLIAIFGLSLLGAGLGEGIQNLSKKDRTPDTRDTASGPS